MGKVTNGMSAAEMESMLPANIGFYVNILFATFSLIIACLVKTRKRFMGIGQLLTMPMLFASNAVYPLDLMLGWLRAIALIKPLAYLIDALRAW